MSKSFWKTDWFIGVVVSVVVLFAGGGELLQSLERKAYDLGVGAVSREPSDKIAVIAIDNIWPISRIKVPTALRPQPKPRQSGSKGNHTIKKVKEMIKLSQVLSRLELR